MTWPADGPGFPPVKRKVFMHPMEMGATATGWIECLALAAVVGRGVDYITPSAVQTASLNIVEGAAPLWVWGTFFMLGAAVVLFGCIQESWRTVVAGHVTIASAYAAIGVGQLAYRVKVSGFDGFRTGWGLVVGGAGIHVVLSLVAWTHYKNRRAHDATHPDD